MMIFNISPQASSSLTSIDYQLYDSAKLQVAVYDEAGHLLRILIEEFRDPGVHQLVWDSSKLKKGAYFIYIKLPHRQWVKKIKV